MAKSEERLAKIQAAKERAASYNKKMGFVKPEPAPEVPQEQKMGDSVLSRINTEADKSPLLTPFDINKVTSAFLSPGVTSKQGSASRVGRSGRAPSFRSKAAANVVEGNLPYPQAVTQSQRHFDLASSIADTLDGAVKSTVPEKSMSLFKHLDNAYTSLSAHMQAHKNLEGHERTAAAATAQRHLEDAVQSLTHVTSKIQSATRQPGFTDTDGSTIPFDFLHTTLKGLPGAYAAHVNETLSGR